ncbi:MAG: helix-turn-helix domain-containing protein [Candidatus Omnitrophota bacterium]|nr:MAG: helix-turn-helix domain-containing protein [Candidatus Omnitrophota bacterium]
MGTKSQAKNPLMGIIIKKAAKIGLKQIDLAKKTKLSASVINRLYNGQSISGENLSKILIYLDLIKTKESSDIQKEFTKLYKELAEERQRRLDLFDKLVSPTLLSSPKNPESK